MSHSSRQLERFAVETPDQLRHAIKDLAIDVPPRGEGRTTDHCEQWQIQRLLQVLFRAGELGLPVSLKKRESPDFLLTTATHALGIEVTEAINQDYAAALMHPNTRNPNSVVDPSRFKWGTAGRTRKQIRNEAARTELTGHGWGGDSPEREFAEIVADTVSAKRAKLISRYERFDRDCLLIYQNQPLPCPDVGRARRHAENKVAPLLGPPGFHKVYVDVDERIVEFTAIGSRIL